MSSILRMHIDMFKMHMTIVSEGISFLSIPSPRMPPGRGRCAVPFDNTTPSLMGHGFQSKTTYCDTVKSLCLSDSPKSRCTESLSLSLSLSLYLDIKDRQTKVKVSLTSWHWFGGIQA